MIGMTREITKSPPEMLKVRLPDGRTASVQVTHSVIEFPTPNVMPTAPPEDVQRRRKALRIVTPPPENDVD
jgi:hypothetical protein